VAVDRDAQNLGLHTIRALQEAVLPLLTMGDGDCLFNAASLALLGHEEMGRYLRLATYVELRDNRQFYLNNTADQRSAHDFPLQLLISDGSSWGDKEEAFAKEVNIIKKAGLDVGSVAIWGLASVLQRPISARYPHGPEGLPEHTQAMDRQYLPRSPRYKEGITIMFTQLMNEDEVRKRRELFRSGTYSWRSFSPNHFVPLVKNPEENVVFSPAASPEIPNDWIPESPGTSCRPLAGHRGQEPWEREASTFSFVSSSSMASADSPTVSCTQCSSSASKFGFNGRHFEKKCGRCVSKGL